MLLNRIILYHTLPFSILLYQIILYYIILYYIILYYILLYQISYNGAPYHCISRVSGSFQSLSQLKNFQMFAENISPESLISELSFKMRRFEPFIRPKSTADEQNYKITNFHFFSFFFAAACKFQIFSIIISPEALISE